jgi:hypothetical protein
MSRPSRPQASSSGSRADIDLLPHTKSSRPTEARILSSQRPQPCRSSKDIRTIRTFVIDCLIASLAILFFIYGIAAARQSGKLLHNNSRTQFQLFEASLERSSITTSTLHQQHTTAHQHQQNGQSAGIYPCMATMKQCSQQAGRLLEWQPQGHVISHWCLAIYCSLVLARSCNSQ